MQAREKESIVEKTEMFWEWLFTGPVKIRPNLVLSAAGALLGLMRTSCRMIVA